MLSGLTFKGQFIRLVLWEAAGSSDNPGRQVRATNTYDVSHLMKAFMDNMISWRFCFWNASVYEEGAGKRPHAGGRHPPFEGSSDHFITPAG